jgi:hypothetical protein
MTLREHLRGNSKELAVGESVIHRVTGNLGRVAIKETDGYFGVYWLGGGDGDPDRPYRNYFWTHKNLIIKYPS